MYVTFLVVLIFQPNTLSVKGNFVKEDINLSSSNRLVRIISFCVVFNGGG